MDRREEKGEGEKMSEAKKIAIMICTDSIGTGEEELGHSLMKSYIYSLTEVDDKPSCMMFLNKGIYLTTEGSPVLEMLKQLADEGVEILTCGACLDYYKLTDALSVGEVTNMYYNVELMHESDNTIVIS